MSRPFILGLPFLIDALGDSYPLSLVLMMSLTPFKKYNRPPPLSAPFLGPPHPDWHHPVHVPHNTRTPIIYSNYLLTPHDDRSHFSIPILYPTLITPRPLLYPPWTSWALFPNPSCHSSTKRWWGFSMGCANILFLLLRNWTFQRVKDFLRCLIYLIYFVGIS